jgi:ATP-dependent Zn protease
VIVFIDEIDSLGSRGGNVDRGSEPAVERSAGCVPFRRALPVAPRSIVLGDNQMGTLEAFLSGMDGMEEPRGMLNRILVFLGFKPLRPYEYKYLMIGATNMMERLDPALLRAGRFGRKIHVTYPKVDGRRRTYEGYLAKVANDLAAKDIEWAARNHEKGTGAEIKDIVNEALLITFRDDREESGIVRFKDLMRAMLWVGFGESEKPFEREAARWAVSVHEAGHAVAFHVLCRARSSIWFATIEKHRDTGGMVVPTALYDDDWLDTREELLNELQVSLASRVAEEQLLGTTTSGHGGDGAHATQTAIKMVNYGHVKNIGAWPADGREVRKQAEDVLHEALDSCRTMMTENRDGLERVAKLLFEKGTVTGDEIHSTLDAMA